MRAMRRVILTAALTTLSVLVGAAPAQAGTARGTEGQTLTATPSTGIARTGTTVTVTGSGYDVDKGVYVAFCVDNGAGKVPSPCGGGADTTGSLGASHWISSNPPSYAEGLTEPYGAGGTFRVTLKVTPAIGDVDCTTRRCVVATRADHTRPADRSQDVRVPVTFAAAPTRSSAPAAGPAPSTSSGTSGGNGTSSGSGSGSGDGAGGSGVDGAGAAGTTPTAAGATPTAAGPSGAGATPDHPAGTPTGPVAPNATDPDQVQVTRVSTATEVNSWWLAAVVVPVLVVVALVGARRRRRRVTR
ncbi:hypothetical protein GA0070617_4743 [Micromonospora yangpuensis]|uniref:Neocarzinostatin family protein n=2 Tax=Micromonospora yangpuensis TaxID=683228 RepID=A0A1C6V612_9ACTN|nr:hypothetical protein GA0070617_4743 [Micromonospora yangpuensis]